MLQWENDVFQSEKAPYLVKLVAETFQLPSLQTHVPYSSSVGYLAIEN